MIILRVAVLNKAEFEFEAHIPHALKAGVPQSKIEALKDQILNPDFSATEVLLMKITDHMTRDVAVPEELMSELTHQYGAGEVVEIIATVAAYNMVSRFLVALNIKH
jgi:alkylhydroperoxidase family enzyme